jgi:DNA-binding MarR family transcriptional regulator
MSLDINEDRVNEKIVEIARKYKLNPGMLRDIVILRNRGRNNAQIADYMGINRNTVNKYIDALNEMDQNDLVSLLALIAIIGAGVLFFGALLESLFGDDH